MKRVWIAAGISALLIAFSLFILFFTVDVSTQLETDLHAALAASKTGDWDAASNELEIICIKWEKQRSTLNTFFHHDALEEIEVLLNNLRDFSEHREAMMFSVKCREVIEKLTCLRECDMPVWDNIL